MPCCCIGSKPAEPLASDDEDPLRIFYEQPGGEQPIARSVKDGWLCLSPTAEGLWSKAMQRLAGHANGRRIFCRLTADALSLYEEPPGSKSGKGRRPFEVIFISSISALLGREPGSECIQIINARGVLYEFRSLSSVPGEIKAWSTAIADRLARFRQAQRQSHRITKSALQVFAEVKKTRGVRCRKLRRRIVRLMPCCEPLVGLEQSRWSLLSRLSFGKEPRPFKGPREGQQNSLVDAGKLAEVTDPELQEAQGAHWSEQAVRFLTYCPHLPQEVEKDFQLALRMGCPDGLKRLVWPLAAGEAVMAPRVVKEGAKHFVASSTHRDPVAFYNGVCRRAFGDVRPDRLDDPVPTFCQGIKGMDEAPPLRHVVRHLGIMSPEGEEALRRLLWCVQLTCTNVEFCPFLPNLMATLLPFFSEAETMLIITNILRQAEKVEDPDAPPRIIWSRVQINKQAKLFVLEAKKKQLTAEAISRLEELGLDSHAVAVELLQDGLCHCLPFRAFCRVVGSFLCEGSEVMLRYGLALFQLRSADLVACGTAEEARKLLASLGEGCCTTTSIDALTKAAFSFRVRIMTRVDEAWGSDYVSPKTARAAPHVFCRPRLFPPRGHCPDAVWEVVWAWVPTWCRVLDPHLIYTPSSQGTSLRTCLEVCKKHQDSPMIFFTYTREGDIIGGFSPVVWVRTSGYLKLTNLRRSPEDAFVFRRLKSDGKTQVWTWSGLNELLMNASELHGLTFGGDGSAVYIHKDMVNATTRACASFSSPTLVAPPGTDPDKDVDFEMLSFEIFALH